MGWHVNLQCASLCAALPICYDENRPRQTGLSAIIVNLKSYSTMVDVSAFWDIWDK